MGVDQIVLRTQVLFAMFVLQPIILSLVIFQCQPIEMKPEAAVTLKDVKKCEANLESLREHVKTLETNLTEVQKEINEHFDLTRTGTKGSDVISIFDYYLSGYTTKCGPQQVSGWTKNVDVHYAAGTTGTATTCCQFSSNQFTVVTKGYYSICGWLRFKQGGNSVDITIKVDGSVKAAFGDAIQTDWRSTGTCFNYQLTAGQKVTMHLESGGSSDCIEETGWRYGRFQGYLISTYP